MSHLSEQELNVIRGYPAIRTGRSGRHGGWPDARFVASPDEAGHWTTNSFPPEMTGWMPCSIPKNYLPKYPLPKFSLSFILASHWALCRRDVKCETSSVRPSSAMTSTGETTSWLESGNGWIRASTADCVAAILSALAARPEYRSRIDAIPFAKAVKDVLGRLSATVDTGVLRVELKSAIGREWSHAADQLQARLSRLPDAGHNLLIIVDELPILVSRMLRTGGEIRDAELLMSWFRQLRQAPELRERICTLAGGSIGLEGVLRRAGLSGSINDLVPFRLDSWSRSTATEFLNSLAQSYEFTLDDASVTRLLDLLRDPVPYHVQLFFSSLRDVCRGDAAGVSPEAVEQCFSERLTGASGTAYLDHYATRLEIALDEHEQAMAVGILQIACRRTRGATPAELEDLRRSDERTYGAVLRDLEADGYLRQEDGRLEFRSNLLREWWRKHYGRRIAP